MKDERANVNKKLDIKTQTELQSWTSTWYL